MTTVTLQSKRPSRLVPLLIMAIPERGSAFVGYVDQEAVEPRLYVCDADTCLRLDFSNRLALLHFLARAGGRDEV